MLNQKLFTALLEENCKALSPLPTTPSIADLDQAAINLSQAISKALNGSAKRTLGQNTGYPWWNKDCTAAIKENRSLQTPISACHLRDTVRKAKRQYWEKKLDSAQEIKDVFGMTKWHKTTSAYCSPPFTDPQNLHLGLAASMEEKQDILVRNLLTNTAKAGDIPFNSPTMATRKINSPPITVADICKAILKAGNTAPGLDEIPTAVLKVAWPLIETRVHILFQACLDHGHHPAAFRTAILAIIPKLNKPDHTSPRAYRPIALLSVLGKGLERLLARKIAWLAISLRVLPDQHFGTLRLRSVVDLTTCLTNDIDESINERLTATPLPINIQ